MENYTPEGVAEMHSATSSHEKGELPLWQSHAIGYRTRKRIRVGPTTQKLQKIFPPVPIAANSASLIGCAHLAAITAPGRS